MAAGRYGPFYRTGTAQSDEVTRQQIETEELWGRPDRGSDRPSVDAWVGALPPGRPGDRGVLHRRGPERGQPAEQGQVALRSCTSSRRARRPASRVARRPAASSARSPARCGRGRCPGSCGPARPCGPRRARPHGEPVASDSASDKLLGQRVAPVGSPRPGRVRRAAAGHGAVSTARRVRVASRPPAAHAHAVELSKPDACTRAPLKSKRRAYTRSTALRPRRPRGRSKTMPAIAAQARASAKSPET